MKMMLLNTVFALSLIASACESMTTDKDTCTAVSFNATIEDESISKLSFAAVSGQSVKLKWDADDIMQLYTWSDATADMHDNGEFKATNINSTQATFSGYVLNEAISDVKGAAIYPYVKDRKIDCLASPKFYVDVPTEQDGTADKYLIASAAAKTNVFATTEVVGTFYVCNTLIKVTIPEKYKEQKITSVTLNLDATGDLFSSAFIAGSTCFLQSQQIYGGNSKTVTVRNSNGEYIWGDVYFTIRPMTNAKFLPISFSLIAKTEDGRQAKASTTVQSSIARGKIYDFGQVEWTSLTSEPEADPEPADIAPVAYTTKGDKSVLFQSKNLQYTSSTSVASGYIIEPDASTKYQTIDGFGAAMTWASCYNLMQMTAEDRRATLKELFDVKEGLGISLVRVTIGASDFNLTNYTWCDTKGIENFAPHKSDVDYVIPVLKEMYQVNPNVRIIASPWSAPKWMKRVSYLDNSPYDSWTGGSINNNYMPDYATYFIKWIRAMEAEGIPIYAVTLQNEPLNSGNSISMGMTWSQQLLFIKDYIGPAFEKEGIKTKILCFDHNFDYDGQSSQQNYPIHIYENSVANKYVAGSAWHNYSGQPSALDPIIEAYPDKEIYFTEATVGDWNYQNFGTRLLDDYMQIYMQMLKRGCKGVTLWNMVLDSERGPYHPAAGSCKTSFGVLNMNKSTHKITDRSSHYYCTAQSSKVIRQGARRIAVKSSLSDEYVQAYLNPDGTQAVLLCNYSYFSTTVSIKAKKGYLDVSVPSRSIVSVIW